MNKIAKNSISVFCAAVMALTSVAAGSLTAFADNTYTPVGVGTTAVDVSKTGYYSFTPSATGNYNLFVKSDDTSSIAIYAPDENGDYDDYVSDTSNALSYKVLQADKTLKETSVIAPAMVSSKLSKGKTYRIKASATTSTSASLTVAQSDYSYSVRTYSEKISYKSSADSTYEATGYVNVGVGAYIDDYTGKDTALNVPATIDGYNVVSVSGLGSNTLKSVVLPASVKYVGSSAFSSSRNLTSVVLPEGLKTIDDMAFYNCYSLATVNIPSTVTSIDGYAFYGCHSLAGRLVVPANVEYVGDMAFYDTGYNMAQVMSAKTTVGSYALGYTAVLDTTTADPSDTTEAPIANFIIVAPTGSYAAIYAAQNGFAAYDAAVCTHCYVVTSTSAATLFKTGKKVETCRVCGNIKTTTLKKKTIAVSSLKSSKKKTMIVKAKKQTQSITGYQIQYSTSKKFTKKTTKTVKVKTNKALSKTVKGLKSGKKYYVRVRAYKVSGKKTTYGTYGATKSVKAK